MASQHDQDRINRRERDLYSRTPHNTAEDASVRATFTKPTYDIAPGWNKGDSLRDTLAQELAEPNKKHDGFFKKFFVGSIIFFLLAVGVFVYMSFGGFNAVSSKNVDITVKGPVAVGGGEELVLDITVTNNNNVTLENAALLIEYPGGTREPLDISIALPRQKETIGTITSGQSVTKTVKAVLFGEKDDVKDIRVSIDYKAQGSNATFTKEKNYQISIKSSPVLFSVNYPKEVNSNQNMQLVMTVTSNSNTLIKNLLVRAEYPFGFSFGGSDPKASFDNNVWNIGDLSPKETRTIKITGKIEGQNDEEKTFRFNAGTSDPNDEKVIGVDFVAKAETVRIQKPFFDVKLGLNGDQTQTPTIRISDPVTGSLTWTNNLPTSIHDVTIEATLSGNAFNRNSVTTDTQGFYQSINDKIVWDNRRAPALAEINPGQSGIFSFNFGTVGQSSQTLSSLRNPEINIDVVIKGTRFTEDNNPEEISYTFSRKVKIATEATFTPRVVYSVGPFQNKGAVPPKAEKETTYTVIWTLGNAFNDLGNVSVSASLPSYVTWLNTKSPMAEKLSYNSVTNKILWEPGDIKAGVGTVSSPREVAFQISFLPSLSQIGLTPMLVDGLTFKGTDRFTGKEITLSAQALTTRMQTDPVFGFNDDVVIK